MKNLTVKSISKFQTHDGYAWNATFYLDGKKVGTATDQGHGGEMNVNIEAGALAKIEAHAKSLPTFGGDRKLHQTADMVLENAMFDTLEQRRSKRLLKAKVVAKLNDGKVYEWKIAKTMDSVRVMDQVKAKYPDAVFLNNMPFDEAHKILTTPTA